MPLERGSKQSTHHLESHKMLLDCGDTNEIIIQIFMVYLVVFLAGRMSRYVVHADHVCPVLRGRVIEFRVHVGRKRIGGVVQSELFAFRHYLPDLGVGHHLANKSDEISVQWTEPTWKRCSGVWGSERLEVNKIQPRIAMIAYLALDGDEDDMLPRRKSELRGMLVHLLILNDLSASRIIYRAKG